MSDLEQANPKNVYGIDLGTTYSCIARIDKFDQPVVLDNFAGKSTTPSVVHISDGVITVGSEAKDMMTVEPDKTISFIKRELGKEESFIKPTRFPDGLDPSEISSLILKKIVKDANDAIDGDVINDVVITCPAYFGTKEKMQTKQAGILAGLNVLAIINEPTAAAIAYGMRTDEEKNILVYDLGGGTFDVTIIRVRGGVIKVIATGGNHQLGGVDWDTQLAEYLLMKYNEEHSTNYTLENNLELRNILLLEAEEKKKRLSNSNKVKTNILFNGKTSRTEITKELFEELTYDLLKQTLDETDKVLEVANDKGVTQIHDFLLVGGSSCMPQVKLSVDEHFKCNAKLTDPHQCVAKGAAIFAMNQAYLSAMEEYENDVTGDLEKPSAPTQRVNTKNVTSKTYGTDCEAGVSNLIFANTTLPAVKVQKFNTMIENQSNVSMCVYESDSKDEIIATQSAVLLDDKHLELTGNDPKGTLIEVTFNIDEEGILAVSAVCGGKKLNYTLKVSGVKSVEEMVASKKILDQYDID